MKPNRRKAFETLEKYGRNLHRIAYTETELRPYFSSVSNAFLRFGFIDNFHQISMLREERVEVANKMPMLLVVDKLRRTNSGDPKIIGALFYPFLVVPHDNYNANDYDAESRQSGQKPSQKPTGVNNRNYGIFPEGEIGKLIGNQRIDDDNGS